MKIGPITRLALLVAALGACRKPSDSTSGGPVATAPAELSPVPEGGATRAAVHTARCHSTPGGMALGDAGGSADLEVGDPAVYADGIAIGFVRRTPSAALAAVALLGPSARGPSRTISL